MLGVCMIDPGDKVLVENPTYLVALQSFHMFDPKIIPVQMNPDGIDCEKLSETVKANPDAKFIYVIPNFQNPTGLSYTKEVHDKVVEILKGTDILLIEDNPYRELRFAGEATDSFGKELGEQCCMLGTFSKIVAPGMRIGWVCVRNKELKAKLLSYKSTADLHLAEDLVAVLHRVKAAQLSPSIARRKNSYIVYIKESAAIEDFLTLTGAVNSAMNLMQIKMYKETYNNLNRVSNCETANLDKTYSAATKQIAAIALISDKVGLDELPADLREAAVLRLENPEMSLREMGERLSISRSGVNHRLRRILEFAEQLGSPEESLAEQSVFEVEEKLHAENAKTEEL